MILKHAYEIKRGEVVHFEQKGQSYTMRNITEVRNLYNTHTFIRGYCGVELGIRNFVLPNRAIVIEPQIGEVLN